MAAPSEESLAAKRLVLNRLKRAQGQLVAVIAAVDADADCRAVITQLSACSSAIDRAGFAIMSGAMRDCVSAEGEDSSETKLSLPELEKLFLTLA